MFTNYPLLRMIRLSTIFRGCHDSKTKARWPMELASITLDYHRLGGNPSDCRSGARITELQPRKTIHVSDIRGKRGCNCRCDRGRSANWNDGHDVGRETSPNIDRGDRPAARYTLYYRDKSRWPCPGKQQSQTHWHPADPQSLCNWCSAVRSNQMAV